MASGDWDHPRMRGEHPCASLSDRESMGSSPHARGARRQGHRGRGRRGIIPACAGSTPISAMGIPSDRGSSPHARGAPLGAEDARLLGGIIPACAGSTRHLRRLDLACEDHPRMRGEHGSCLREAPRSPGSSPHARGAPRACRHTACQAGIIPACAGSTVRLRLRMLQQGDHPRMRGEHPDHGSHIPRPVGSSPHARGAQGAGAVRRAEVGIIPACAGSTLNRTINGIRGLGSSPLARGAQGPRGEGRPEEGIIPACAGSTLEYLRLCPGLKRITLTLPITSEAGKWTEKHPNDQLMPRAFRPSR